VTNAGTRTRGATAPVRERRTRQSGNDVPSAAGYFLGMIFWKYFSASDSGASGLL
jgi:hypothetical protein